MLLSLAQLLPCHKPYQLAMWYYFSAKHAPQHHSL